MSAIYVRGLRELQRDLDKYAKDVKKELRVELATIAEPVARTAEQNALANISHIGPTWSRMRIGITTKVVYVAPKTRRKLGTGRPNLAGLLGKEMDASLDQHESGIEKALEAMLDRLGDRHGF